MVLGGRQVLTQSQLGREWLGQLKRKALITLAVAVALVGVILPIVSHRSGPPVAVTLRIAVVPPEQVDFVTARAKSAQFKYLVGKQSGVKPVLAQKLTLERVPQSAQVEARVGVLTAEEGRRYAEAFLPTLQDLCGRQVRLTLAEQSIR